MKVLQIMGHVLLSLLLLSSHCHKREVLAELPERPGLYLFFFKIAAYFLRSRFGFPGADTEVSGQDGNQRCAAVSAPAAQGAGVAIIGPACFLPHDTYQVNLLLSLFVLTS